MSPCKKNIFKIASVYQPILGNIATRTGVPHRIDSSIVKHVKGYSWNGSRCNLYSEDKLTILLSKK